MNIKKFRILFCLIEWDLHIYLLYIYVDISIKWKLHNLAELIKISNKFFFFINDINFYKHFSSFPLFYILFFLSMAYKYPLLSIFFFLFFYDSLWLQNMRTYCTYYILLCSMVTILIFVRVLFNTFATSTFL